MSYSGIISQSDPQLGLTKAGAGELILAGANAYTGETVVQSGTLQIKGGIAGPVTVDAAAFLKGGGSIDGAVDVAGTLVAGNQTGGAHDPGRLDADEYRGLEVEIGSGASEAFDPISVGGAVNLGGATLSVGGTYAPLPGDEFKIIDQAQSAAVGGTFDGLAEGA